jgi:hypothetical protein
MDTNRIPKQALQYKSKGRRNIRRPKKRWRDQFHFDYQGTGNNESFMNMMMMMMMMINRTLVRGHGMDETDLG